MQGLSFHVEEPWEVGAEAMPWLSQLCYRTPRGGSRTERESPVQNLPLAGDTYSRLSNFSQFVDSVQLVSHGDSL